MQGRRYWSTTGRLESLLPGRLLPSVARSALPEDPNRARKRMMRPSACLLLLLFGLGMLIALDQLTFATEVNAEEPSVRFVQVGGHRPSGVLGPGRLWRG